jgi:hypothetical protein
MRLGSLRSLRLRVAEPQCNKLAAEIKAGNSQHAPQLFLLM